MTRYVKVKGCDGLYSTDQLLSAGWTHYQISQYCTLVRIGEEPAPAWVGVGAPPVGTVCEVSDAGQMGKHHWWTSEIRYLSPRTAVLSDPQNPEWEITFHPERLSFRPIRTPEQIAAEERTKAANQIREDSRRNGCSAIPFDAATALYDAGYRK